MSRRRRVSKVSMTMPQWRRGECALVVPLQDRERDLLTALLISGPLRPVTRDELIEQVWSDPNCEPNSAYDNLRGVIMALRAKGIPIVCDARGYVIG